MSIFFTVSPQVIVSHTVSQIVLQDKNTVESQALWVLGFAIHHLCLQLESAGEVVQVDPRLCQPVSTPTYRQGLRVACTVGDVDTVGQKFVKSVGTHGVVILFT